MGGRWGTAMGRGRGKWEGGKRGKEHGGGRGKGKYLGESGKRCGNLGTEK